MREAASRGRRLSDRESILRRRQTTPQGGVGSVGDEFGDQNIGSKSPDPWRKQRHNVCPILQKTLQPGTYVRMFLGHSVAPPCVFIYISGSTFIFNIFWAQSPLTGLHQGAGKAPPGAVGGESEQTASKNRPLPPWSAAQAVFAPIHCSILSPAHRLASCQPSSLGRYNLSVNFGNICATARGISCPQENALGSAPS